MSSNLLHEALETDFTYIASRKFRRYNPSKFVMPAIKVVDPFAQTEVEDYVPTDATLLTREQEYSLFMHYNYLKKCCKLLVTKYNKEPLAAIANELVEKHKQVKEIKTGIAYANVRMVVSFTHRSYKTSSFNTNYHELLSEANLTLNRCIDKFDPGRGYKFSTLLGGSIFRSFLKIYGTGVSKHQSYTRDDVPDMEEKKHLPPDQEVAQQEMIAKIKERFNAAFLTPQERIAINLRYFADPPYTLDELGGVLNLTKERCRQIQVRALEKLRHITADLVEV